MRTSLEIVPRSAAALLEATALISARYPGIDTVNIPDLGTCELSSLDAVALIDGKVPHRIPHLRARDFTGDDVDDLVARLHVSRIDEVIVINGDDRGDIKANRALYPNELIARLTARLPQLAAYAAIDPHQYRDDATLGANIDAKRAAGAAGFFTQPLFSLHDIDRIAPLLQGAPVFWGLSPVISPSSQRYWERVNRVQFPADFLPTLKWSQQFALRLLSCAAARGDNAYLMPIRVAIAAYLEPLEATFAAR